MLRIVNCCNPLHRILEIGAYTILVLQSESCMSSGCASTSLPHHFRATWSHTLGVFWTSMLISTSIFGSGSQLFDDGPLYLLLCQSVRSCLRLMIMWLLRQWPWGCCLGSPHSVTGCKISCSNTLFLLAEGECNDVSYILYAILLIFDPP